MKTLKDRLTTIKTVNDLKDRQRLAVIPKDPETPMAAKDRQRHSATDNDYMKTRI